MKLDLEKPVQTRDGRVVEIINHKMRGAQPIAGYVGDCEQLYYWSASGSYYGNEQKPCNTDLINIPEKRTVEFWVNVYAAGVIDGNPCWNSREKADDCAGSSRIDCLYFRREFNVGEGL